MHNATRMRWVAVGLACLMLGAQALADSPKLSNLLPVAGQRGQTVKVTFYGDRIADSSDVLFHGPGIVAEQMANNDKQVTAVFRIAPDAPLGEHKIRLATSTGVSEMITFQVVDNPIVRSPSERDPKRNNRYIETTSLENPQVVEMGTVIYGRTHQEDVDFFAVDLKSGQRLTVQITGMSLGRGFTDSHLIVLDSAGKELVECDDTDLLRQDPYVSMVAPSDGRYIIKLRDSGYIGGDNNWYLMHVGSYVRPAVTFPLGGKPGEEVDVKFMGDAKGTFSQRVRLPGQVDNAYELVPEVDGQRPPTGHPFRINQLTNVFEDAHPKNDSMNDMKEAPANPVPAAFNGVIDKERDHDYFKLDLKKGQSLYIRCFAGSMGSPLDPVINLFNAKDNKHLVGNDDAPNESDSVITYDVPADGPYYIRVRDHLMRGGEDFVYRLEVMTRQPHLATSINRYDRDRPQERQAIAVPQGNRMAALVRVQRTRVGGDIQPWFEDLPQGIQTQGFAPDGRSEMPIVFEANANAAIGAKLVNIGAQGGTKGGSAEKIRGSFSQQTPLVMANPNRTEYYHTTLDRMPVAVTQALPFSVEVIQPKAPLVKEGKKRLQVKINRDEGFNRDVRLYMLWRPPGMGAAGSVYVKKDQGEVTYEVDANNGAGTRSWPLAIIARVDMPTGPAWVSSQLFNLGIEDPFVTGSITKASCMQGETVDIKVKLDHLRDWQGEGELVIHGLPAGCETQPLKIKPGQEEVTFKVKTGANTPANRHKSLMCQLTIQVNGEPVIHRFGRGGQLRIDKPRNQQARLGREE